MFGDKSCNKNPTKDSLPIISVKNIIKNYCRKILSDIEKEQCKKIKLKSNKRKKSSHRAIEGWGSNTE